MNYAALIPVIRDIYGFSNTQMGFVASMLFLAYTLFQIPSGILADRYGIRYVIAAGCLLISAGNLILTTWLFSFMILAQFINGMGQSTGWGPLIKFISGTHNRAKAIGILSSAVPAGTFLSFMLAGFIAERFGIDYAFILPAILLAILAGVSMIMFPPGKGAPFSFRFIKNKNIAILAFIQFSVFFSMIGLFTWLPAYFFDAFGINEFNAVRVASLIPLAGIIGGIAGGYFSDRAGEKNTITLNQFLATVLFLMAFFIRDLWLFLPLLFMVSVFFRFGAGATYGLAVKLTGNDYPASVSGYITFVGNIGGVISTFLAGSIIDSVGFQYVFIIFGLIFGSSTVASLYLRE